MQNEASFHLPQEAKRYVRYLWDELPKDQQDKRLKLATRRIERAKAKALVPDSKGLTRYGPFNDSGQMLQEIEGILGLELDDGWFRLCVLHQYQTLMFYIRERHEALWTSVFSKNLKATRENVIWPQGTRSPTMPWKDPCVYEAQLLPITWVEEHGQYKVEFQFGPGVTQTFWFRPNFKDSSYGEGWVTPRNISKTVPFK